MQLQVEEESCRIPAKACRRESEKTDNKSKHEHRKGTTTFSVKHVGNVLRRIGKNPSGQCIHIIRNLISSTGVNLTHLLAGKETQKRTTEDEASKTMNDNIVFSF